MSSKLKFLELSISNFMSYGNNITTINLDFSEPILIVGENLDAIVNGQIDSNGAGKSAILDALAFALYDTTISKKEKSQLINNINKKNMEVSVTFLKGSQKYKIIRSRKTKSKGDVKLMVDNGGVYEDKTPDSIGNANAKIADILGLPFEVFSRIVVYSADFQPFLDLPSRHATQPSQTSIMEELFGYTEISKKAEVLKGLIKNNKTEFTHLEELQKQIALEQERHNAQIESVKKRVDDWDKSKAINISEYKENIAKLEKIDFDSQRQIFTDIEKCNEMMRNLKSKRTENVNKLKSLRAQVDSHKSSIDAIAKVKEKIKLIEDKIDFDKEIKIIDAINKLELEVSEHDVVVGKINIDITANNKKKSKLMGELSHLDDGNCPYCEQKYEDSQTKIESINGDIKNIEDDNYTLETELDIAKDKISTITTEKEELLSSSVFKGSMSKLNSTKEDYSRYTTQVETFQNNTIDIDKIELDMNDPITEIQICEDDISDCERDIQSKVSTLLYSDRDTLIREESKVKSSIEKLSELEESENPHISTLDELSGVEFDNDKSNKLNEIENEVKHQEFLLKLLTKKDSFIRKALLDKSLPFLNQQLSHYLGFIGLPHKVEFQPDMSVSISQFGTELTFDSLSKGQKARVNLALAFAFRDVLQARHGKIDFCVLDECLDTGLGNVGVQLAANMIKSIAKDNNMAMFIITHRDEVSSMFANKMTVQLKSGFTTIVD